MNAEYENGAGQILNLEKILFKYNVFKFLYRLVSLWIKGPLT